jgi:microcystin-dependent protein
MGLTGEMKMWPAANAPTGWMLCEGGAISRTTFAALFTLIGTTYGVGDGTTTFNVPDMRGRVPAGFDTTQTEFNARGKIGGEKTHLLTSAEMPSHTHVQPAHSHNFANGGHGALTDGGAAGGAGYGVLNGAFYGFNTAQPAAATATNNNTGGGGAHNVLQPYLTIKYIIKT